MKWLFFSLFALMMQALFTLFEMACISFNRIRLNYFASLGKKTAIWLRTLLQKPARLFSMTIIGICASLQIGSECARRFYTAMSLDPDLAPITQVVIVIFLGELVPLFAARRHPEALAMALAPFMATLSKILRPVTWAFEKLAQGTQKLLGQADENPFVFSREEVQKALEEGQDEFHATFKKIFRMKISPARQAMVPLQGLPSFTSDREVGEAQEVVQRNPTPFFLVYHGQPKNIVGAIRASDIWYYDPRSKVVDAVQAPWFTTQESSLLQVLEQLQRNERTVALLVDNQGEVKGLLSRDQIVDALFGVEQRLPRDAERGGLYVERTLPGSLPVAQFNRDFQASLIHREGDTLSDLIVSVLDHAPAKGESIELAPYEFTVVEPTMLGAKFISVKTID